MADFKEYLTQLNKKINAFFSFILSKLKNFKNKTNELKAMTAMVKEGVGILKSHKDLNDFGKLLNESWKLKRSLASIVSTSKIDAIYETGIKAGAIGGKLLGAGGGGFMLFFAPPERHAEIKNKLKKFLHVPFRIEHAGSQIIYPSPQIKLASKKLDFI